MNVASIAGLPRWYVTQQLRHFRDGKRGTHPEDKEGKMMQNMTQVLDDKKVAFWGSMFSMKPLEKRKTLKGGDEEKSFTKMIALHVMAILVKENARKAPPSMSQLIGTCTIKWQSLTKAFAHMRWETAKG